MTFRKLLFWMHLVAGCVAGVIVLTMSVTGVLLTYERQILAHMDRGPYQTQAPAAGGTRLTVDELIAKVESSQGGLPRNASLVLRSDPAEPAEINLGREGAMYVNPYDGRVVGKSDQGTRRVFQRITAWHRWLGTEGPGRNTARAITGASNFAFLFIVASGMYLWLPKVWSLRHLRSITWFKGGLSGKARDFNWHNVFGIWAAIPLLIVVASAVPMSYTWANNLLYQMTGSEIPRPNGPPGERGDEKGGPRKQAGKRGPAAQSDQAKAATPRAEGKREAAGSLAAKESPQVAKENRREPQMRHGGEGRGVADATAGSREARRRSGGEGQEVAGTAEQGEGRRKRQMKPEGPEVTEAATRALPGTSVREGEKRGAEPQEEESRGPSLNALWMRAESQVAGWQSISLRIPERAGTDVNFAIDTGDGGQPQKRSTLTLDSATGSVKKFEGFSNASAGRQLRTWSRFTHTGEYYGIIGQTIAGIASFAGVMLVWTGISLALRRLAAWRSRRAREVPVAAELVER